MLKKILPFVFLFFTTITFFYQIFLHLLPIPADTIVGLYHPYRDLYAKEFPRGIPFKNFLITDPVRQQYPWRYLSVSLEKKFQLPLWNPYSFAGSPLLANLQSAPLYPLNVVFFFLPFSLGWTILVILQPLLSGIFLYLFLRKIKLSISAALLGSFTFAFSGFSIAWMEWNTVTQVILWLPLILYLKEILLIKFNWKLGVFLVLIESTAFFAGHLQVWFYLLLVSNAYLFFRIIQTYTKDSYYDSILLWSKKYMPFLFLGMGVLLLTSVQWLPTFNFITLSARDIDLNWKQPGWFIPWQHAVQFVFPDFFGNPTTLNYWGVWNYAEFVGYVGIIPLLFACFAVIFIRTKQVIFWIIVLFFAVLFAFPTPLAQLPFQLSLPFISTAQPTRLLSIIDLCLAILAAYGFDYYCRIDKKWIVVPLGVITIFVLSTWLYVLKNIHDPLLFTSLSIAKKNMIFPTAILAAAILLSFLNILFGKRRALSVVFIASFLLISVFDLFRFGEKFSPFTKSSYLYPSTRTIDFLQSNIQDYRFMTTNSEILPPNFSVMYGLQSVDGYDPLYLKSYGEFIAASERGESNITPPFGFNRIITPHNITSPLINLLGVKYILSLSDISNASFKKVFQEGETRVYENMHVLPRVFFVKDTIKSLVKQQTMDLLFNSRIDLKKTAVVSSLSPNAFTIGNVFITSYNPDSVSLQVQNNGRGFLILTDVVYPTWHAYIDKKETSIYTTDYLFRGIIIPKGRHTIVFADSLF